MDIRRIVGILFFAVGLSACGEATLPTTPMPTLGPVLSNPSANLRQATAVPIAERPTEQATPTIMPVPASAVADDTEQYRQWMIEARTTHPYSDTVETMWQVMVCESSGNPTIQGPGGLIGLFQYQSSTWADSWNPYREQSITDARAQIFATAKAWSDGNQAWWSVCLP